MEKKNLKWYEAPAVEIVEVKADAALLAGSPITNPDPGEAGGWEE